MSLCNEPRRGRRRELGKFHYQGWDAEEVKPSRWQATRPDEPDKILTATTYSTMCRWIRKANEEAGREHNPNGYVMAFRSPEEQRREEELSRWERNWVDPPWLAMVESEPG